MSRVDEILSWYGSDHPGVLKNLRWMMDTGTLAGTGKMVILPVDQGFEHGPARSFAKNPDGYDPLYHYQLAVDAGCNAYAAPRLPRSGCAAIRREDPDDPQGEQQRQPLQR
jgi:fructose-bisphosphate aldolase, class I